MILTAILCTSILAGLAGSGRAGAGDGLQLGPDFEGHYAIYDLGQIPGLEGGYAGMTLLAGAPAPARMAGLPGGTDMLLIGGYTDATSAIYAVSLIRDDDGHISGFFGTAQHYTDAPFIDGGLTYYGDVLLYTRYGPGDTKYMGEIGEPGGDYKVVDLAPMGVTGSGGGLGVVPFAYQGAGQVKLLSYADGRQYTLALTPDSDFYDVQSVTFESSVGGGPENAVWAPKGSPGFEDHETVLVNNYPTARVDAFDTDAGGNPVPGTKRHFLQNAGGPEGSVIDVLTGDMLIGDINSNRIYVVEGFTPLSKGDLNCDYTVGPADVLALLSDELNLPWPHRQDCPAFDQVVGPPLAIGEPWQFADLDCDSNITSKDALALIKHVAGLATGIQGLCQDLG